jgi:hypothetical protein
MVLSKVTVVSQGKPKVNQRENLITLAVGELAMFVQYMLQMMNVSLQCCQKRLHEENKGSVCH